MKKFLNRLAKLVKLNIRFLILLVAVVVVLGLHNYGFKQAENFVDYSDANLGDIRVGKSEVAGRGVFANRNFAVGEVIEVCPLVEDKRSNISGRLADYLFDSSNKGQSYLPFGYCAVVNHSFKPNAVWKIEDDRMIMLCIKEIKAGEEIFHSYGEGYWNTRKDMDAK